MAFIYYNGVTNFKCITLNTFGFFLLFQCFLVTLNCKCAILRNDVVYKHTLINPKLLNVSIFIYSQLFFFIFPIVNETHFNEDKLYFYLNK